MRERGVGVDDTDRNRKSAKENWRANRRREVNNNDKAMPYYKDLVTVF